ncbi:GNAT family N-acetyltransferase [Niallia oryzisoli]|uniref:GNAT family N-acetyltransferase n=1 Tax=Niallia oryzisoli TaxID=1737571 RepID=A0ABZ2C7Q9_9BACI
MIRKGRNEDIPAIMKLVKDTVQIMKEEKSDQWDEKYPTVTIFENDAKNESLYVYEENGKVFGSITVDTNLPNEYHDISWRKKTSAYTFHRLVISAAARKKGMASSLIAYAEKIALQNNVPYMKIDTYSLNKKAQALFEKCGYVKAGEMAFHGKENPFYCYDKILTDQA